MIIFTFKYNHEKKYYNSLNMKTTFYPTKSRIYELPGVSPINPRKNKRILIYFSKEEAFDGITVGPKSPNL